MRAVVLALTVSTGCSFALTSTAPPPCHDSSFAPITDTAIATVAAIAAVYLLADDETGAGAGAGAAAVGFGVGAYVGHRRVGRCRAVTR